MKHKELIMEKTSFPIGWEIKTLGEVCELYQPKTISKKEMDNEGLYPVFGANGIIGRYNQYNHEHSQLVITCRGATCGSVNISEPKSWINGNAMVVKPIIDGLLLKYIEYFFRGAINISEIITGAAQPQITRQNLSPVKIPLPSLPQQKQIVAILDKAFAAIDTAKTNAEQNLQNAKELFESYLQNVFENKGDDWELKRFDEICVLQRGFDLPTRLRNKGEYPLVSSSGITDYVDLWKVKSPGVSTGRSGTIGIIHYIEKDYFPLNTSLYIKEFHGNDVKCIYYFLKQFNLSKFQSGAGVPTLNRNNVHPKKVYFPNSIDEQKKIVKNLDTLSLGCKKLEAIYTQKIADLEEMKKSILQKAFSGQLLVVNN